MTPDLVTSDFGSIVACRDPKRKTLQREAAALFRLNIRPLVAHRIALADE